MDIFIKTAVKTRLIFFLVLVFCLPAVSFAANLFINSTDNSTSGTFSEGQEFLVSIFLNTEGKNINAVEGKILFPSDLLEIKAIRDGNSSVNFWIEKPNVSMPGAVAFSGITPGGLLGENQLLFGVVAVAKKSGNGAIGADEIKVLLNDGKGTQDAVTLSDFKFEIRPIDGQTDKSIAIPEIKDVEKPEDFKPIVGNDPNIFNGKYFLVFATQDKGSGIDHYEIREGFWGKYAVAESPFVLTDQFLRTKIYVKAVDKSGNERATSVNPMSTPLYQIALIFGILLVVCFFIFKKTWPKFFR